jgi:hypothetical protein
MNRWLPPFLRYYIPYGNTISGEILWISLWISIAAIVDKQGDSVDYFLIQNPLRPHTPVIRHLCIRQVLDFSPPYPVIHSIRPALSITTKYISIQSS